MFSPRLKIFFLFVYKAVIQINSLISIFMLQKFEQLNVLMNLDQTHGGSTRIVIGNYQDQLLVCKSIDKQSLKDSKSIEHIKNQKEALLHFSKTEAKGINRLVNTFQDQHQLYIVLEPVKGLPLHKLLQMVEILNPRFTLIVVSQIGLILKNFHQNGFIYRDVKASNFMVDEKGRVTMIDLGHSKRIDRDRTYTICGTTHSMPPEIYEEKGYSYEFDHYGFGILIFQLLTGNAPFGYGNTNPHIIEQMKKGIQKQTLLKIPCSITRDLVARLLEEPSTRLGSKGGFEEILQHDYFNVPEFCLAKDIYEGADQIDPNDPQFELYISEIVDFGIQDYKFEEISPEDPFYKFYQ